MKITTIKNKKILLFYMIGFQDKDLMVQLMKLNLDTKDKKLKWQLKYFMQTIKLLKMMKI